MFKKTIERAEMEINFSHNWNNKLTQSVFTTIRGYTPEKWEYYFSHLGDMFDVLLSGQYLVQRKLISISKTTLQEIPIGFLMVDTGKMDDVGVATVFRRFGIRPTDNVIVLCFGKE